MIRSTPLISLPLMGIGNFPVPPGWTVETMAHYPSWGLETDAKAAGRQATEDLSLPLMGIGNPHFLDVT